jgi:glutamine amidotransferase
MISIIDYGLGNLKALANIYKRLNIDVEFIKTDEQLKSAKKIILPGVGAFDHAMEQLNRSGMREKLDELVLVKKVPVLGICVGMQMLANRSDEGKLKGLSWIDADIIKFDLNLINQKPQLPHMGWNDVNPIGNNPLFHKLGTNSIFYFLHSYYFSCNNPNNEIAKSEYGLDFTCAVNDNNIFGVQFHPEKSHQYGIQLLKNFANL